MMNAVEMFGLAIRILGVVLLCFGIQDLDDSGLFKLGYFTLLDSTPPTISLEVYYRSSPESISSVVRRCW